MSNPRGWHNDPAWRHWSSMSTKIINLVLETHSQWKEDSELRYVCHVKVIAGGYEHDMDIFASGYSEEEAEFEAINLLRRALNMCRDERH